MMKTYPATCTEGKTSIGLLQDSGASRETGDVSNREVRSRFLHTSARYLGVEIEDRELVSRYIPA